MILLCSSQDETMKTWKKIDLLTQKKERLIWQKKKLIEEITSEELLVGFFIWALGMNLSF
jgi:hypothetical protein